MRIAQIESLNEPNIKEEAPDLQVDLSLYHQVCSRALGSNWSIEFMDTVGQKKHLAATNCTNWDKESRNSHWKIIKEFMYMIV